MVIESVLVLPRESVTDAVMVWTPSIRSELCKAAPVIEPPCISDVHAIESLMPPSSGSAAAARKVICSPESMTAPSRGWMMTTVGGSLDTVIVMDSDSVLPAESVVVAVMICSPSIRNGRHPTPL